MDISEKRTDNHTEAISCNGPCGMFTAASGSEVLACHEDAAGIRGIIEHEIGVQRAVRTVAPIPEEIVAKEILFTSGRLQEARRYDLIRIHVLQRQWHTSRCNYIEFLFHSFFPTFYIIYSSFILFLF